jgi:hypothetical protein
MDPDDWPLDVDDEEREAMEELNVRPGFNDYSSDQVLDAYRLGRRHERERDNAWVERWERD